MKKIASVLCFILCAALVGCSESTGKSADTEAQSVTAPATETAEDTALPETTETAENAAQPVEKTSYEDCVGGWFVNETKEDCLNVRRCDENEMESEDAAAWGNEYYFTVRDAAE